MTGTWSDVNSRSMELYPGTEMAKFAAFCESGLERAMKRFVMVGG